MDFTLALNSPWVARLRRRVEWAIARAEFASSGNRLNVYETLAQRLADGAAPREALQGLAKNYRARGQARAVMFEEWLERLSGGRSVSQAISDWLPPSEVVVIAAGERAGDLPGGFAELEEMLEQREALVSAVRMPLLQAAGAFLGLFAIAVLVARYIIPVIQKSLSVQQMPPVAANYFSTMGAFNTIGPYLFLGVVGLALLAIWSLPRWTGRARAWFDYIPPWSIYRALQSAWFVIALAAMLRRHLPPLTSLEELRRFSSPYMKVHINRMLRRLGRGMAEGEALNTGLFPREMAWQIEDNQSTTGFSQTIDNLARRAIKQTTGRVTMLALGVNTSAFLIAGAFVAWSAYAIMGVLTGISSSVGF